ncbi:hypothetical protein R3W88_021028 [Solanum pinnatisectum]|uniref:Uncharacterized protein n=1 Tax=Solanum pinnatisectum TaxID=50273 RepID=A0AAV9LTE2_9SOLN|nr:hypothetical protein R3W88_021028 [Solanum pinnatisectum]
MGKRKLDDESLDQREGKSRRRDSSKDEKYGRADTEAENPNRSHRSTEDRSKDQQIRRSGGEYEGNDGERENKIQSVNELQRESRRRIEIMKCVDRREEKVGMMTAGKGNTKEMKRKISTGSMRKKGTLSVEGMNRRRSIEAECVIVTKVMIHTRGLDMMIHILVEGEDMMMKSMLIGRLGGESCSIDIVSCQRIKR